MQIRNFPIMNFSRASLGRGFSLMELMIAISVMGILVVSAAPALNYLSAYGALSNARTQFVSALRLARSQAIRGGESVLLKTRANSPSGTNEWGDGLTVWVDTNNNNALNDGEEVLVIADLVNVNIDSVQNATQLSFSSTGRLEQNQNKYVFEICREGEAEGYSVEIISKSGGVLAKNKGNCNVTSETVL